VASAWEDPVPASYETLKQTVPAMKRSNRQFENREELREAKLSRSFHKMEKRNDTELKIAKLRH